MFIAGVVCGSQITFNLYKYRRPQQETEMHCDIKPWKLTKCDLHRKFGFVKSPYEIYFSYPFIDESKIFKSCEISHNGHYIISQLVVILKVILLACTVDTVVTIL
jgi:hypothetical protein